MGGKSHVLGICECKPPTPPQANHNPAFMPSHRVMIDVIEPTPAVVTQNLVFGSDMFLSPQF